MHRVSVNIFFRPLNQGGYTTFCCGEMPYLPREGDLLNLSSDRTAEVHSFTHHFVADEKAQLRQVSVSIFCEEVEVTD